MLKRQLYHMTFLDQKPDDPFEVIAYNDSEHLDEYDAMTKTFADFQNSGLPEHSRMSFDEFLRYPNWFADWLLKHWSTLVRATDANVIDNALEKELRQIERSQKNNGAVVDPFKSY